MPEKMTTPAAGYREGTLRPCGRLASRDRGGGGGGARRQEREDRVQRRGDLVEAVGEVAELAEQAVLVEDAGQRAQQVAEQVAGARDRGDVEVNLVELDPEPEQVEVQRAERQVQNVAGGLGGGRVIAGRQRGGDRDVAAGDAAVLERAGELADGVELAAAGLEALDRVRALEVLALVRAGDGDLLGRRDCGVLGGCGAGSAQRDGASRQGRECGRAESVHGTSCRGQGRLTSDLDAAQALRNAKTRCFAAPNSSPEGPSCPLNSARPHGSLLCAQRARATGRDRGVISVTTARLGSVSRGPRG